MSTATTERWEVKADDLVYVLEGDRADSARQQVISIRSTVPLVKRQEAAGIPKTYRRATLANWQEELSNPGTIAVVFSFLKSPDRSLYLYGSVGVGKTFAACTIGNELLESGKPVRFVQVSDLLLRLRDTFSSETASEMEVLRPLLDVPFLVLDELGDLRFGSKEIASSFTTNRILTLLDQRWRDSKTTIVTSNLSLEELVHWVGDERIGSRIRGLCGPDGIIEIVGRDLRFDKTPAEASNA